MEDYPGKGACFNCGFLSLRDTANSHLSEYLELTQETRENGNLFRRNTGYRPWCFRNVAILRETEVEADKLPLETQFEPETRSLRALQKAATAVIKRDRRCKLWFPYTPGIGPREHFEEFKTLELEEDRRRWEADQARIRQEWEDKQAELREAFDARLQLESDKTQKAILAVANRQFWIGLGAILATFLATFLAGRFDPMIPNPLPVTILTPSAVFTASATETPISSLPPPDTSASPP